MWKKPYRTIFGLTGSLVMVYLCLGWRAYGQDSNGQTTGPAPQHVEPKADEILRRMGTYMAGLKAFSFEAYDMVDDVLPNGQKIQYSDCNNFLVRRPDRVQVEFNGDTRNELAWYNGKTLTVYERQNNEYGVMDVPDNIDGMLDHVANTFGVILPLAELLFSNPYDAVIDNVESGAYIGLHQVHGEKCHHLAFRQAAIDWQIWIQAGDKPLPRKIVITYRERFGQPQYVAITEKWNLSPDVSDEHFQARVPDGAKKVDLKQRSRKVRTP